MMIQNKNISLTEMRRQTPCAFAWYPISTVQAPFPVDIYIARNASEKKTKTKERLHTDLALFCITGSLSSSLLEQQHPGWLEQKHPPLSEKKQPA